jgi:hypothetical protein
MFLQILIDGSGEISEEFANNFSGENSIFSVEVP